MGAPVTYGTSIEVRDTSVRHVLALCLLAGGLEFGVGSAASWLLSRTAPPASGTRRATFDALPELVASKHKTFRSEFVRRVPLAVCLIGCAPANLGFRVVVDDEPAKTRRGILPTRLQGVGAQSV